MRLFRLTPETEIKPFESIDSDLNEFLLNDSKNYLQQLLAVTYILEDENNTIAYFSMLNDKISAEDLPSKRQFKKKFSDTMPDGKKFKSYPAVKTGRFAVHKDYIGNGQGRELIDFIKETFISNNRTGCGYLTVDAYSDSLTFYEKNGFLYFTDNDKDEETRQMYFDLHLLIN